MGLSQHLGNIRYDAGLKVINFTILKKFFDDYKKLV